MTFSNLQGLQREAKERASGIRDKLTNDVRVGLLRGVEKAGLKSLDYAFRQKHVHDGLLYNLKTSLKHKESIPDSK